MNLEKFKQQHMEIINCITQLRHFSREGIVENAVELSRLIVAMSSIIKLHLAVEDKILYPALESMNNPVLKRMGKRFQEEMACIASVYIDFAKKWNSANNLAKNSEEFRSEANKVLKILYERMQRENIDFYPVIEAS
ncbi:hypothetical protein GALL_269550 [mine drainage metagenome]|uniref:Hemerythrin-like domain-containing protein n=1 Tax=mine drainage metagenome TaxID=410659 RepID=A0A1J5R5D6_9ZZZZ